MYSKGLISWVICHGGCALPFAISSAALYVQTWVSLGCRPCRLKHAQISYLKYAALPAAEPQIVVLEGALIL